MKKYQAQFLNAPPGPKYHWTVVDMTNGEKVRSGSARGKEEAKAAAAKAIAELEAADAEKAKPDETGLQPD